MFRVNKKTLYFLIIFSFVLIGITIGGIYYANTHDSSSSSKIIVEGRNTSDKTMTKNSIIDDGINGVKLSDGYSVNDIILSRTDFVPSDSINSVISYFQISGLKDLNIQNKINEEVKGKVFDLYEEERKNNKNIDRIRINLECSANYSDVLSIKIVEEVYENNDKSEIKILGMNYRLANGDKIEFQDLFTYNTSVKNIINQELYKDIAFSNGYTTMENIEYADIEDKMYEFLYEYSKKDDQNYYFNESNIYLYIDNICCSIPMYNYYENIAIYNRFVSLGSLYSDDCYILENIPVFTKAFDEKFYTAYYRDDKCVLDIISSNKEYKELFDTIVLNKIENMKNNAQESDENMYYDIELRAEKENDNNVFVYEDVNKYTSNSQNYQKYIMSSFIEQKRKTNNIGRIEYYYDDNYVSVEKNEEKKKYDIKNKKEVIERPETESITQNEENENTVINNTVNETNDAVSNTVTHGNNTNTNTNSNSANINRTYTSGVESYTNTTNNTSTTIVIE